MMSNNRRMNRSKTRFDKTLNNSKTKEKGTKKYISLICAGVGIVSGFVAWWLFYKCEVPTCINSYYPLPYMGIGGFVCWIIGQLIFKE